MIENLKEIIYQYLRNFEVARESQEELCFTALFILCLVLAWLSGYICRKVVAPLLLKLVRKTDTVWDDYLLNGKLIRSICRTVPGIVFYILIPVFLKTDALLFSQILLQGSKIYIAITFIALTVAFLDNVETFTKEEEKLKEKHLYGIIEFLKIVIYFIGCIIIIAFLLGEDPFSLVAGIGAAATVLMLVFKDSILGLVAGIQLASNQMIKPGDWITIKKSNIDGIVEKISLTTVKVRNFDNTIYTVPPYTLISETFQNWSTIYQGGGRRMKRAIFIDQTSISIATDNLLQTLVEKKIIKKENTDKGKINLTLYREYIEDYLKSKDYIIKDKTILVRQLAPTPQGLPLEFYFFLKITDFVKYESLCAECMEHFIAILPYFGLKIYQSGWEQKH